MAAMKKEKVHSRLVDLSSSIRETAVNRIRKRLDDFESRIARVPSPTPPPRTTLQIQGEADTERAWQNYLGYFLDPSAYHGMGTDALNHFLAGLNRHVEGNLPERVPDHISEEIDVFTERASEAGNQPDLVIWQKGRFFVCCELKLYSPETGNQTQRYAHDDQVGRKSKEAVPEDGQHYVYIKRRTGKDAASDRFRNVTWGQVAEWLTPLLHDGRGRYPSRTAAQLSDFLDTIHLDMTDDFHLETEKEKMDLYFQYLDAIEEAKAGLKTVYENARENWRRYFLDGYAPDTWTEEWHCDPRKYGQFYHSKWRQEDGLELPDGKVEMHFVHLIRHETSFTEGTLTVELRWSGGRNRYKQRFEELFQSDRFASKIGPVLGKHDIVKAPNVGPKNPRLTRKVYEVDRRGLPTSYFEALSVAVKEHQQLAPAINKVLETAIEEVDEETQDSMFDR